VFGQLHNQNMSHNYTCR